MFTRVYLPDLGHILIIESSSREQSFWPELQGKGDSVLFLSKSDCDLKQPPSDLCPSDKSLPPPTDVPPPSQ